MKLPKQLAFYTKLSPFHLFEKRQASPPLYTLSLTSKKKIYTRIILIGLGSLIVSSILGQNIFYFGASKITKIHTELKRVGELEIIFEIAYRIVVM